MKLRVRPPRPRLATIPLADVALSLFAVVACAGIFSAVRGIGVRFDNPEPPDDASRTVWVRVLADGTARVDGERVGPAGLADAVRLRRERDNRSRCVVHVASDATYQTALDALSRLSGTPGLSIPTQREVEAYIAAAGFDPFEPGAR